MAKVNPGKSINGGTYSHKKLYVQGGTATSITVGTGGTVYVLKGMAKANSMKDIVPQFKKEFGNPKKTTKNSITWKETSSLSTGFLTVEKVGKKYKISGNITRSISGSNTKGNINFYNNKLSLKCNIAINGAKGNVSISCLKKSFSMKGTAKFNFAGYSAKISINNKSLTGSASGKIRGYSFTANLNNYKSDYLYITVKVAGTTYKDSSYIGWTNYYNQTKNDTKLLYSQAQSIAKKVASMYNSFRKPKSGLVQDATVKKGGSLIVSSGGIAKNTTVQTGGKVYLYGGSLSGKSTLKGASIFVVSAGSKIGVAKTSTATKVSYDLVKKSAGSRTLLAGSKQSFVAGFSVLTAKNQQIGTYTLSTGLRVKSGTAFAVKVNGAGAGNAKLGGAELAKNGMTYKVVNSSNAVRLVVGIKEGSFCAGSDGGESLAGTAHSDVFFGGEGNDTINGVNGRDVAVYGTEEWGSDVIRKTSGTMSIVFNGVSASEITQNLSGSTMTITKVSDNSQQIKIEGWNAGTHNLVFGKNLSQFTQWAGASPEGKSQFALAARSEAFKAAGLAKA